MNRTFSAALVFIALVNCYAVADAAEVPARFRGVWAIKDCNLPKKAEDVGEFPYLVVTSKGYETHESSCSIKRAVMNDNKRESIIWSCSSEGDEETRREVWSIAKRSIEVGPATISEDTLVRQVNGDTAKYQKCALSVRMAQ